MTIFGFKIINAECYNAERNRVKNLTRAFETEQKAHDAYCVKTQEEIAKLKNIPQWHKSNKKDFDVPFCITPNIHYPSNRLFMNGFEIGIDDLWELLPKED